MKTYSCKVRLRGNVLDEVRKERVTEAEMTVLKAQHGDDAVSDVAELPEDQFMRGEDGVMWREADERNRLQKVYGERTVERVFGRPVARISEDPATAARDAAMPRARRSADPLAA